MKVNNIGSAAAYSGMDDLIYGRIAGGLDRGTREFNLRDCPATERALKMIGIDYGLDFKVEKLDNNRMKVSLL